MMGRAFGLVMVFTALAAAEDAELRREVEVLRHQISAIQNAMVQEQVEAYLADTRAAQAQGGDGLRGISIHTCLTAVGL